MSASRKPRKKKARKPKSDNPPPPNQGGMEGLIASLLNGQRENDPVETAREIVGEAWEATDRRKRIALARKALKTSPLCVDAYVVIAQEEAKSFEESLSWYQKGVEAGERALGPEGFEKYAGHFWGFWETRPYMRARAGLAEVLWELGRQDEAIVHWRAMLALNPNDNQGIRYVLASRLLARDDIEALKKLLEQYDGDCTAAWRYTQALLAFREKKPDADKRVQYAWRANRHVPGMLSGKQPLVRPTGEFITWGGEDEAGLYIEENGEAWRETPGAINWLSEATKTLKPAKRRGPGLP